MVLGLVGCGGGEQEQTDVSADSGTETQDDFQPTEGDVLLFGGSEDYSIVYSADATTAVKDMLVQMSDAVKEITGKGPKRVGDNSKTEKEAPREILIAATNRDESKTVMDKITSIGYRVEFVNGKLVIAASNDTMLQMAVDELLVTWKASDGQIALSSDTVLEKDMSDSMLNLYAGGEFRYKVIVQASASAKVREAANTLATRVSNLVGKTVKAETDASVAAVAGAYEICIGNTNREVSTAMYSELSNSFEYRLGVRDTYISVASKNDECLINAVTLLADDLSAALFGNYCGSPAIAKDYAKQGALVEELVGFPDLGAGSSKGVLEIGDGEYVMYYVNVMERHYTAYVDTLKSKGCEVKQTYTLGGNKYTLMENDAYSVYVAYLNREGSLRVIFGKPDVPQPAPASPTEANVCEPALWQLEIDCIGGAANGGMSYVIQLTDGTFVVIDGGYRTDAEANNLYNLLKANTVGGGEPVISAWLITHLHLDHWGCLEKFSQTYADKVEVKAFYYNFPGVQMGDINTTVKNNVEKLMRRFKNATLYSELHSGMNFSVVDAKFTVICTFEDVFPLEIDNGNDTTTVFKVEVGGQSIMFLGDAYFNESTTMFKQIDAAVMKSDIVQISHHGYEGCSRALYEVIDAHTVLWPMPIVGADQSKVFKTWFNNSSQANTYFRESASVKKIIVSGAGTEKLTLPYTPSGAKVPNYEAIYNERT